MEIKSTKWYAYNYLRHAIWTMPFNKASDVPAGRKVTAIRGKEILEDMDNMTRGIWGTAMTADMQDVY